MHRIVRCLLTFAFVSLAGCSEEGRMAEGADVPAVAGPQDAPVEVLGSYQLVRRDLPDGTVLTPPAIVGFMTYTGKYRNFHLYQPGAADTRSSVSMLATYSIAGNEYSETALYEVLNNLPERSGLAYNVPGATFTTPILRRGQMIEFRDGEAGPILTIGRDSMVATLAGTFVDRWVRVE